MKYLMGIDDVWESKTDDLVKNILDKASSKVDTKKIWNLLSPYKSYMDKLVKKYTIGGVIDSDKIYGDIKALQFGVSESRFSRSSWSFREPESYDRDENNNVVLRLLYRFFVRWPKDLITGLWELFNTMIIDEIKDRNWFVATVNSGIAIITSIVVYLLGYWTYQFTEHAINGLDSGKVQEIRLEPAHYETHYHTVRSGKSSYTYTTHDYVADRWHVDVVGDNGREEMWVTYSPEVAHHTRVGQTIVNDDAWTWEDTEKTSGAVDNSGDKNEW
jgi:hypothetical protein